MLALPVRDGGRWAGGAVALEVHADAGRELVLLDWLEARLDAQGAVAVGQMRSMTSDEARAHYGLWLLPVKTAGATITTTATSQRNMVM